MRTQFSLVPLFDKNDQNHYKGKDVVDRVLNCERVASLADAEKLIQHNQVPDDWKPYHVIIGGELISLQKKDIKKVDVPVLLFDGNGWRTLRQSLSLEDNSGYDSFTSSTRVLVGI